MAVRSFVCSVCGFHYQTKKLAGECFAWCRGHKSCNEAITQSSLERSSFS